MAYEQRNDSGSLFKNTDKGKDTHPDYKGSAQVDGVDYWMDAWIKKSESGRAWMSFSFKRKEAKQQEPPKDQRTHAQRKRGDDEYSDVPF